MFFRRRPQKEPEFAERLEALREAGFEIRQDAGGSVTVSRDGCTATLQALSGGHARITRAGRLTGHGIALLVDGGYQKFWQTEDGRRRPALASHLQTLHDFEEDLREGLGLESLYNTSLGTTNDLHLYDRLEDRDRGVPRRPWDRR